MTQSPLDKLSEIEIEFMQKEMTTYTANPKLTLIQRLNYLSHQIWDKVFKEKE